MDDHTVMALNDIKDDAPRTNPNPNSIPQRLDSMPQSSTYADDDMIMSGKTQKENTEAKHCKKNKPFPLLEISVAIFLGLVLLNKLK